MQKINDIDYYTMVEFAQHVNLSENTVRRRIQSDKIRYIHNCGEILIPSTEIDRIKKKNTKFQPYITKTDLQTDQWLQIKENIHKIKKWIENVYVQWNEMSIEDYIAYWKYLINPLWIRKKTVRDIYPSTRWLVKNGFKGFKQSFEHKYLLKLHQINTLNDFWVYLTNNKG
ncbi:MAG: helix-turn-helix domain-containing protein [Acidithiobacillus sp.]|uniref:helix-turn-helix domain-containing protein n=1 Tax=Acidithiobacillus sp. TaxID=1872118 RepID=UPI00355F6FC8